MAEDRMAVLKTVRKAITEGDVDFLREGLRVLAAPVDDGPGVVGDAASRSVSTSGGI